VGVQLNLDEIIAGTIARREGTWVFNLNRADISSGEIRGRVFREIEGDLGAVADALNAAIPDLYAPQSDVPTPSSVSGALSLMSNIDGAEVVLDGALIGTTSDGHFDHTGIEPGVHEVRVLRAGYHTWVRTVRIDEAATAHIEVTLLEAFDEEINPLVWVGASLAAGALAAAIPLGVASQDRLNAPLELRRSGEIRRIDAIDYYASREREALAAMVLYGLAGAAAIASLVALFMPTRTRRDRTPQAGVRLVPGGVEGWF
jgi:hypothetical protein